MITNLIRIMSLILLIFSSIVFTANYFNVIKDLGSMITNLFSAIIVYSPLLLVPALIGTVISDCYHILVSKSITHRYLFVWDIFVPVTSMILSFSVLTDWATKSGLI